MMKRTVAESYQWIYYLTTGLLFVAVVLRTVLLYSAIPASLSLDLAVLAAWLILFISEPTITRRWNRFFPVCLTVLAALVVVLLYSPDPPDYFAILFALLSMRAMEYFTPGTAGIWIAVFIPLTVIPLEHNSGLPTAVAYSLVYTAGNVLFASFSLAARHALTARSQNQLMLQELEENNRQLRAYSAQMEQLAVARERNRLARELHDSVTQTVFSMTLTTQSALLLLDNDPTRVKSQLDHLSELAKSALAEMQTLIFELRPEKLAAGGLAAELRRHIDNRHFPDGLSVTLQVEGSPFLSPAEEHGLFRIAQEALNNVVKHSHASKAFVRLGSQEPLWLEIEDNGQGFDLEVANQKSGVGLCSMRERAAEIGWNLRVDTSPGAGARIRIQKGGPYGDGSQN